MGDETTLRAARREDAGDIARLFDLATEGLIMHYWSAAAAPGEDGWAVGTRRAADDAAENGWRRAVIVEVDRRVAGATATSRVTSEPVEAAPAMLRPVVILKNRAEGTEWIHYLAVYPEWRRRGIARQVLTTHAGEKRPFFVLAGFRRPHEIWAAPEKYFQMYSADEMKLPDEPPGHDKLVPEIAFTRRAPNMTDAQRRMAQRTSEDDCGERPRRLGGRGCALLVLNRLHGVCSLVAGGR